VDLLLVLPLQFAWICRSLLVPMMAAMGSSFGYAASDTALDIVLNSVAVGFIFELDDILYTMLLPLHQRLVYETSAPERGTVLDVPGSAAICSLYTWCFVVADITIMMLAYVKFSSSVGFGSGSAWYGFWQASTLMSLRAGISLIVSLHMVLRRNANKYLIVARQSVSVQKPTRGWGARQHLAAYGLRLLLSAFLTMASSFLGYKIIFQGLVKLFGFSDVCIAHGSEMDVCIHSYSRIPECVSRSLNWTVPGQPTTVLTYSYEANEDHWTMRSWGPVAYGCVPRRESSWDPLSSPYFRG